MSSVPDILSSSYRRDKEDTGVFTTWLSNAAQRCGYKPAVQQASTSKPKPEPTSIVQPVTAKGPRLKGKDRDKALHDLEAVVQQRVRESLQPRDARSKELHKQLTPSQFITQLAATLPAMLEDIRIPYITLTKICNKFMTALRAHMRVSELQIEYPQVKEPGESVDHGFVVMVLQMLMNNSEEERMMARVKRGDREYEYWAGAELNVAGEYVDEYMKTESRVQLEWEEPAE